MIGLAGALSEFCLKLQSYPWLSTCKASMVVHSIICPDIFQSPGSMVFDNDAWQYAGLQHFRAGDVWPQVLSTD